MGTRFWPWMALPFNKREGAISLVTAVCLLGSCTDMPPEERFVKEFYDTVQTMPEAMKEADGMILVDPGFVCRNDKWEGSKTDLAIISRPLLGFYSDGRVLPVTDPNSLTNDDLAIAIDSELVKITPLGVKPSQWSGYRWNNEGPRSSKTYFYHSGLPDDRRISSETMENKVLIGRIVKIMGLPKYALSSGCGTVVTLYYGNPSVDTLMKFPKHTSCNVDSRSFRIDVEAGNYTVLPPKTC